MIRAACLMPTHYHAVVRSASGELTRFMRDLNGGYARAFNRRYGSEPDNPTLKT